MHDAFVQGFHVDSMQMRKGFVGSQIHPSPPSTLLLECEHRIRLADHINDHPVASLALLHTVEGLIELSTGEHLRVPQQ